MVQPEIMPATGMNLPPAGVSWRRKTVGLRYYIGGFGLFRAEWEGLSPNEHWTAMLNLTESLTIPELPREIDVVHIPMMPAPGPVPTLRFGRYIQYARLQYRHCFARLNGSFADYMAHFSAKSRSTLMRKVRKVKELSGGKIDWKVYCGKGAMPEFHRLAHTLSVQTYQQKLFNAGLSRYTVFEEQVRAADDARGYILFHRGKPVSYLFCPVHGGILLYHTLGYDAAFRKWSPGTVLQFLAFESLFKEGCFTLFDFGPGEGQHKELFSTGSVFSVEMYYFKRTLHHYVTVLLHRGLVLGSSLVAKLLERLRVKHIVKRWIRGGSPPYSEDQTGPVLTETASTIGSLQFPA